MGAPSGFSTYHSLQITLNREFTKGLTLYTNYVFSKTLANVDSSLIDDNDASLDYYNLKLEKSIADKVVTYDFARLMTGATQVSCSGFGQALIERM